MSRRPAQLRELVPLSPLTTLEVGGPARLFLEVHDEQALVEALAWARVSGLATLVLGGGSNLLVSDRGFDGLVVRVCTRGLRTVSVEGGVAVVEVGAGEPLDDFVRHAVERGYGGVEALSGIPGSVGATPVQNVGAYGQEVRDTIRAVHTVDRKTGASRVFDNEACRFGYRTSAFKDALADRYVVTAVTFALATSARPVLRYAELERAVKERSPDEPTLAQVREVVLSIRRAKSMVIDASDPNRRSAGSFFVNPTVTPEVADAVEHAAASGGTLPDRAMPRFASERGVKLSAAWLIEQAGFVRGMGEGPVGLSTRHALCIVNRGGATAQQIVAFAGRLRAEVRAKLGVALAVEPVRVGFSGGDDAVLRD